MCSTQSCMQLAAWRGLYFYNIEQHMLAITCTMGPALNHMPRPTGMVGGPPSCPYYCIKFYFYHGHRWLHCLCLSLSLSYIYPFFFFWSKRNVNFLTKKSTETKKERITPIAQLLATFFKLFLAFFLGFCDKVYGDQCGQSLSCCG